MMYVVAETKNKINVTVSHIAFEELSFFVIGKKTSAQKITAGKILHFINGILLPREF